MAGTLTNAANDVEEVETGQESSDEETPEEILEQFDLAFLELKQEWGRGKGRRNLTKVGRSLNQAKLLMAKLDAFLPNVGLVELSNIRSVLEIGAYHSLEIPEPDIDQFVRYTAQLKSYYLDYSKILPESPHKYELHCAKLLYLLTENQVADFQMELALILHPPEQVKCIQQKNPILFKTMKIAEYLEDGRYNAIDRKMPPQRAGLDPSTEQGKLVQLEAQGDKAIHESDMCRFFLNKLVASYRPVIAETLERSYERWPKKLALERLRFKTYSELERFAAQRNWISKDGENYTYEEHHQETTPARELIAQSLNYAHDLDQII